MISHNSLLVLGFTELTNRPQLYNYKGITGRLLDDGSFHLHGFSLVIDQIEDLQYIQMLIDHQRQLFPASSDN